MQKNSAQCNTWHTSNTIYNLIRNKKLKKILVAVINKNCLQLRQWRLDFILCILLHFQLCNDNFCVTIFVVFELATGIMSLEPHFVSWGRKKAWLAIRKKIWVPLFRQTMPCESPFSRITEEDLNALCVWKGHLLVVTKIWWTRKNLLRTQLLQWKRYSFYGANKNDGYDVW